MMAQRIRMEVSGETVKRPELVLTPEMVDAGSSVFAQLEGEVSRSFLVREVFEAMAAYWGYERRCE